MCVQTMGDDPSRLWAPSVQMRQGLGEAGLKVYLAGEEQVAVNWQRTGGEEAGPAGSRGAALSPHGEA